MSKILGTMAAFALLATLALPGSATAAEPRADGLRLNQPAAATVFSSVHRYGYWRHRHVWHRPFWRHRYVWHRPYWRHRYVWHRPYWRSGFYRPYYRPWYAGYPYGYYRPGISVGFGFGPRWGW